MTYDVAIVGAGPTGYFCAYELIAKDPSLKVVVIDKGLKIDQRTLPSFSSQNR
jgi:flavin-dependent dehydrogenase